MDLEKLAEQIRKLEIKNNKIISQQQKKNVIEYFEYLISIMKDPEPLKK